MDKCIYLIFLVNLLSINYFPIQLKFEWNLSKTILGRTVQNFANKSFFARDFRWNLILLVAKQVANLQQIKNIRIMVVFMVSLCNVMKYTPKRWLEKINVHIFWEGHKILRNLNLTFEWYYIVRKFVMEEWLAVSSS